MHRLVLRSELKYIMPYDEIINICFSSARSNKDNNITGFMVECGGVFLFSIEGKPVSLRRIIKNIKNEERHQNIKIIFHNKSASARLFGSWSMNMMFLDDALLWQKAIGSRKSYDGFYAKSYDAAFAIGVLILSYRYACEASQLSPVPCEDQCGHFPHRGQILGA
ncbi:BLUF domain-containing protein (plasmid) [Azospirillum sp. A26]|uniref:BLUF domain-containing protein n=1 Tax=Azospirillum sp. A26 TaxID=3160607 RepID=UPI00366F13DE